MIITNWVAEWCACPMHGEAAHIVMARASAGQCTVQYSLQSCMHENTGLCVKCCNTSARIGHLMLTVAEPLI